MRRQRKKIYGLLLFLILMTMSLGACSLLQNSGSGTAQPAAAQNDSGQSVDTGLVISGPGSYDSADTALLMNKNEDDNTVILKNLELGKTYTLTLDGTTTLTDKYGEAISLNQIEIGDIVDVTFLKNKKHLNSMQISPKAWSYESVNRYEINDDRSDMTIGKETFKLSKDTLYLSDGRNMERMDLNESDIITVKGIDTRVLSIQVEKGHGYLRLTNDENFIGGWIEIGQSHIQRIEEDMLLTVPEGTYQVSISYKGGGGIKDVIINRNEEATLDIGDLDVAETQYGTVIFSLSPSKTSIYIDGEQVDASAPITLEYGIHQLIAKADGYKSITTYLKVGQASAGVDITLDAINSGKDEEEEENKEESTEESSESTTTSSYYKVYVDAPESAEVYLDGNYVGISPCSFRKTTGTHVITLRKTNYETRSYTVQIDDEEKDLSYSFADLVPSTSQSEPKESSESTE